MGLQPYTILSINNKELKEKLKPAAYNQPQITEGSHLIVYAAWDDISELQIDAYLQQIADVRGVSIGSLADFRASLIKTIENKSPAEVFTEALEKLKGELNLSPTPNENATFWGPDWQC